MSAFQRNLALFGGMIVAGTVCAQAATAMISARGTYAPAVFLAQSPLLAAGAVLGVFIVGVLTACFAGRMVNAVVGLFVLGAGLFVLAGRLTGGRELAFTAGSNGRWLLVGVAIETLMWSALVLAGAAGVFLFAGRLDDVEPDEHGRSPHWLRSREAMLSAGAGVLMLPAVWVIAQSPLRGQVIGATILGGMLSGLVGRLVSPHVQPLAIFASPIVFGALGHLVGAVMLKRPLDEAMVFSEWSLFSLPMPIDYAAGSLIGVALGLGWAKSFLHHEQTPDEQLAT